ncbi:efflux RND transporter permease subunit [Flavobacteriaceae bacterium S0862]|nr:efflux RND transporter permease subunit [Flavobacteriaceae bacterium S0862]
MVSYLIKYRYLVLILVVAITWFFASKASLIKVNADSAQYFQKDDNDYEFYERIKSEIKTEENLILLAIHNENGIFNYSFLLKVQEFSDSLKQISNIHKLRSLTDLSYPTKTLLGIIELPYLNIDDSANITSYKTKIFKDSETTDLFINKDGTSLFLWIELKEGLNKDQIDELFDKINDIRHDFPELTNHLWGRKHIENSFKQLLFKEFQSFIYWILFFLLLALLFIFKRPWAIIFPLIVVICSILIFLGSMVVFERPLGMMSSIFPTIILIVGVSDVIHMAIKYDAERRKGRSAKKATHIALNEIGWTTFITSVTTAIGFFTLLISPMKAMQDLGLESGIIVMFTYFLTIILIPTFFVNNILKGLFSISKNFNNFFDWFFKRTIRLQKSPRKVLISSFIMLIIGLIGIMFINTNSVEYKIPRDSELKKEHIFFENNFGGSRTFELVCVAKDDIKLNQPDILNSLKEVHDYLSKHNQLNSVKSPILYYSTIHMTLYPSKKPFLDTFINESDIARYEKYFTNDSRDNYLFNDKMTVFKFKAQTDLLGRHDAEKLNQEVLFDVQQLIDNELVETRISGINFLMDLSQKKSIKNMLLSLLLAMIVVAITLGFIFKNIALMFLSLILNFIPIVITAGILGFTGLELRGEISLIFTIGFVIAVDDTIHLLSKYQWERKQGKNQEEAIYLAQKECGKAILATSIILIGGFLVLIKSTTVTISILGIFTAMIVIFALAVDLILAPVLVLNWFKKYL